MNFSKIHFIFICLYFIFSSCLVIAQVYPLKTVRIIVPYVPGGGADILARGLAKELNSLWGQQVIVENISGADSIIGALKVSTSNPDGHTLLLTIDTTVLSNRFLYKNLPYDPDKGLMPITMLARTGSIVIVHPSLDVKNIRELIEFARNKPDGIVYSSAGKGTPGNLILETIAKYEKLKFIHVPYKGVAPATLALISGEAVVQISSPAAVGMHVKSGKARALAVTSPQRIQTFSNVPTMIESGYPYANSTIWWGLFTTGGTDYKLVERIYRDVAIAFTKKDFVDKHITPHSLELVSNSPQEFADMIRTDLQTVSLMIKAAAIKAE